MVLLFAFCKQFYKIMRKKVFKKYLTHLKSKEKKRMNLLLSFPFIMILVEKLSSRFSFKHVINETYTCMFTVKQELIV